MDVFNQKHWRVWQHRFLCSAQTNRHGWEETQNLPYWLQSCGCLDDKWLRRSEAQARMERHVSVSRDICVICFLPSDRRAAEAFPGSHVRLFGRIHL